MDRHAWEKQALQEDMERRTREVVESIHNYMQQQQTQGVGTTAGTTAHNQQCPYVFGLVKVSCTDHKLGPSKEIMVRLGVIDMVGGPKPTIIGIPS